MALNLASASLPGNDADAKFKDIYTKEWTWRELQFRGEDDDDRKMVADHLPKVDPATQAMRLAYWQDVMKQLGTINPVSLSQGTQVDYAVYKPQIQVLINDQIYRDYEMPANSDSSFWSEIAGAGQRKLKTADEYRRYIAYLNDIPRYFREQTANMRAGLARGFTPPKVTMVGHETSVSVTSNVTDPEKSSFYGPFKKMPDTIPAADQAKLQAQAKAAIANVVLP